MTDPDYKYAAIALRIQNGIGFALKAGWDRATLERWRELFDAIFLAISSRGARFAEIVEAVQAVRKDASILRDLPTGRAAPPAVTAEFEAGYAKGRADASAINDDFPTIPERPSAKLDR